MASLEVSFAGISFRNPVIIASAPPTESVENIMRCADAGAAGVVTKTLSDYDEAEYPLGARRAFEDRRGLWALSTFRRETFSLQGGLRLIEEAARRVDIPVVASVGAMSMNPDSWLSSCRSAESAGARAIQLDLFYVPHPRASPENIQLLIELLSVLASNVGIPIVPKLNIELPAHYISEVLKATSIKSVFAIDSLRVPVSLDPRRDGHGLTVFAPNAPEASLFGQWQMPITLQYARTLVETSRLEVCAGGGLMNGFDAVEAILLGATTVQFATTIIRHGYKRIGLIVDQIHNYMEDHDFNRIEDFRGRALTRFAKSETEISFIDVKAAVDDDLCTMCGHCTTLVFCPDIQISNGRIEILDHCDGCGLCIGVCPTAPKALSLKPPS